MKRTIARLLGGALLAMMSLVVAHAQAAPQAVNFDAFRTRSAAVAADYVNEQNGGLTPAAVYLPSSVRFWVRDRDGGREDCSGVVISSRKVLTAAHCVCGASQSGAWFAPNKPDCDALLPRLTGEVFLPTEGVVAVTHYDVHPSYRSPAGVRSPGEQSADLAILTLARSVSVAPARIGQAAGGRRYLMGSFGQYGPRERFWPLKAGHIYQPGVGQINRLREAQTGPQDCDEDAPGDNFCAEYFARLSHDDRKKNGTACGGDSGGGLYDTTRGRDVVVGIVSYVSSMADCDDDNARHTYAVSLERYRPWIAALTRGDPVVAASRLSCADYILGDPPEQFVFPPYFSFLSATAFGDRDNGVDRPSLMIGGVEPRRCAFSPDAGVGACALEAQERPVVAVGLGGFVQVTVCWNPQRES